MKTRLGFVANSSGSSFILGVAEIIDKGKFTKWLKKIKYQSGDVIIMDDEEINKRLDKDNFYLKFSNKKLKISNFKAEVEIVFNRMSDIKQKIDIILNNKIHPNKKYAIIDIQNGEGDGPFIDGYDVDINYFEGSYKYQRKIYEGFIEENGLKDIHKTYGAGRDG